MTGLCPTLWGGKIEGGCQRLALAILDGPLPSSNNNYEHSCLGPSLAAYKTVLWGVLTYLLGIICNALLLSGNARNDVRWWFY